MDPVAIVAVLVGFLALGVSAWVGFANQKHNRLSVRPNLVFIVDRRGSHGYPGISLRNDGFGPAIIRKVIISVDGKDLGEATYNVWVEAREKLGINYKGVEFTALYPGVTIGAGRSQDIFFLNDPTVGSNLKERFNSAVLKIALEVKYGSLYDESWITPGRGKKITNHSECGSAEPSRRRDLHGRWLGCR